jgi:DNA-binding ferritin-like protein
MRTITFKDVSPTPKAMAGALLTANEALIKQLYVTFKDAEKENQQGILNFIAERIDMHMKWSWQLRASTK